MTAIAQKELQRFWRFNAELRVARENEDADAVRELVDEIDTIRLMTDSDTLRKRCCDAINNRPVSGQAAEGRA